MRKETKWSIGIALIIISFLLVVFLAMGLIISYVSREWLFTLAELRVATLSIPLFIVGMYLLIKNS